MAGLNDLKAEWGHLFLLIIMECKDSEVYKLEVYRIHQMNVNNQSYNNI
jgi:hypothetical protein